MKKFKVIVRWPSSKRIDETIVEADRYYQSKYSPYHFIKEDERIASFPARTTIVMEMK